MPHAMSDNAFDRMKEGKRRPTIRSADYWDATFRVHAGTGRTTDFVFHVRG
jgi:hypothetical protein